MAEYVASVKRFKEKTRQIQKIYSGHSLIGLDPALTDDIIAAGEEIIARKTHDDTEFTVPYKSIDISKKKVMQHKFGSANIIYDRIKTENGR